MDVNIHAVDCTSHAVAVAHCTTCPTSQCCQSGCQGVAHCSRTNQDCLTCCSLSYHSSCCRSSCCCAICKRVIGSLFTTTSDHKPLLPVCLHSTLHSHTPLNNTQQISTQPLQQRMFCGTLLLSNGLTHTISYNLPTQRSCPSGLPKPHSRSLPLLKHWQHQALTAAGSSSCSSCCSPKRSSPVSPMQSYTASATEKSSFCV